MDFIELIFRIAPDNGSRTLEFLIVAALLILPLTVFARWREVRKNNQTRSSRLAHGEPSVFISRCHLEN